MAESSAPYLLRVRLHADDAEPRDFHAACTRDNGWLVHLDDQDAADRAAQYLRDMAELHVDDIEEYLPDPDARWAQAILLAFPESELLEAPDLVSEDEPADRGGNQRVY